MANKNFNRYQAYEKEVKALYAEVAIGASGAPTLTSGLGITSIVRDSAGKYTVTLDSKYTRLMAFHATLQSATVADLNIQQVSSDVNGAKTVVFHCVAVDGDGAPAATDPASGNKLFLKFELKNTSAGE